MKFIHVDVDRASRKYNNFAREWNQRQDRKLDTAHPAHINWPPEKVAAYRKVHWVKPHRKWAKLG